jgi:hypothetical protein
MTTYAHTIQNATLFRFMRFMLQPVSMKDQRIHGIRQKHKPDNRKNARAITIISDELHVL